MSRSFMRSASRPRRYSIFERTVPGLEALQVLRPGLLVVELHEMENAEANDRLGDLVDLALEDEDVDLVHAFGREHAYPF